MQMQSVFALHLVEKETMRKYSDQELARMGLSAEHLPGHVAMIMDGNGRWATVKGFPRALGHREGVNRLRGIIRLSSDIGIDALTLYAFSTENWRRPKEEKSVLFELLIEYFHKEIDELHANDVRITALGDLHAFPQAVEAAVQNAMSKTKENRGLRLNICLNYGGRDEIIRAAEALRGTDTPVTEALFARRLYTAELADVDFLIRTGGEMRISNFLLFQSAYAELYFTEKYWPDFSDGDYLIALRNFAQRKRRFGGLEATP